MTLNHPLEYEILRKYIKCFGLMDCTSDTCPFMKECFNEMLSNPDKRFRVHRRLLRGE